MDLTDFWRRHRDGVEVAVDTGDTEALLGVRDGFRQYFHDGLERPIPVGVRSAGPLAEASAILLSDEEILARARAGARSLAVLLEDAFPFYASSETGIHSMVASDGVPLFFVRTWVAVRGPGGEGVGGSGSVQLPPALIAGLDAGDLPFAVPGRRRKGGMVSSLTGGLQTRRSSIALATTNAISSLLYGVLESRPFRRSGVAR